MISKLGGNPRQLSINDMISAVNVKRLSGDESCCIVGQEGRGYTYVVNADKASRRSLCSRLVKQGVKLGNPRGGPRRERARGNSVDTDALRTELGRNITDSAFERCFRDAHYIVDL